MLDCYGLYPTQSVIVKYGSRKMSGSQVVSSILFIAKMSEYVFVYYRFLSTAPQIFQNGGNRYHNSHKR